MWSDSGVAEQSDAPSQPPLEMREMEVAEDSGWNEMEGTTDGMEGMEMDDMDMYDMDMYDMEMDDMEWEEDMYDELERLSAFRCDYCGQKSCEGDCQY